MASQELQTNDNEQYISHYKELFVSKYALQLPKKETLKAFIVNELKS